MSAFGVQVEKEGNSSDTPSPLCQLLACTGPLAKGAEPRINNLQHAAQ